VTNLDEFITQYWYRRIGKKGENVGKNRAGAASQRPARRSLRGIREDQRQSKGVKQARAGGFHKQREPGNQIMLKREHVNGMGGPRRVRAGTDIHGESRLTVGCGRYQENIVNGFPRHGKEGTHGVAPCIPLQPRRHGVGRVLFEKGHETVQIMPLPGP
jgi:hypothetical protein